MKNPGNAEGMLRVLNDKLIPVTRLVSTALVMVVHPAVPANPVKEYVVPAKSSPNKLTYASGGAGAITRMVGELLKSTAVMVPRLKSIGKQPSHCGLALARKSSPE